MTDVSSMTSDMQGMAWKTSLCWRTQWQCNRSKRIYRVIVNECYKNKQVTCNKFKQFFCCHVLRFIVNVWTFTINTNLTAILFFFGSCDISTTKSNFSLQVCFAVVEGSDKMGNFEVRKSDLSKRLDERIKLNFSMIRRDITGTSFLYKSPRAIQ